MPADDCLGIFQRRDELNAVAASGDTKFDKSWLVAVSEAEASWKSIQRNEEFRCLTWGTVPDLAFNALLLQAEIRTSNEDPTPFPVTLAFVLMVELGLLKPAGDHWQMCIPAAEVSVDDVRAAALKLVAARNREVAIHPELFITTIPRSQSPFN